MLGGIFPSVTTPFDGDEVNPEKLKQNIEKYNALPLGGYMILGGNGEYLGLTEKETLMVLETVAKDRKSGRTLIAGAGRESAKATIDFIKTLAAFEVDIASVITPFYFARQMGDENLIAYFQRVADESPIPLLIYNSPAYAAGVELSLNTVSVLSRHGNIAGMKNSSARELSEYAAAICKGANFCFHVGKAANCCRDFTQGAVGATLSFAAYQPELCIRLYEHFRENRLEEAWKINERINGLYKMGISKYGASGVKYAMDLCGYFGGMPRLPLLPLTEAQKSEIEKILGAVEERRT